MYCAGGYSPRVKHYKIMKLTSITLTRLGALAIITGILGLAGCKTSSSTRTMGQRMSDRQIARGVKDALGSDPTFKFTDVTPNVYDGNVQLTGFVEMPEQRLRAAELAARTRGTRQVINEVMIKPLPTGSVTIRDPLGNETGRMLIDTNSPVPHMRNEITPGSSEQNPNVPQGTTPRQK